MKCFLNNIKGDSYFFVGLIDPEKSLFTYPEGLSPANFSFPEHMPDFVDEVVMNAPAEVVDMCDGNTRCIFDATQTGNIDVGLDTMHTEETNMEDRVLSGMDMISHFMNL